MAITEKKKDDWNLAMDRLKQIGNLTAKVNSFHYQTLKKQDKDSMQKWKNSLKLLHHQLNLYLIQRDHTWDNYRKKTDLEKDKDVQDLEQSFETVQTHIDNHEYTKGLQILEKLDKIINYARIEEGFDIPNQFEKIDETTVATDKRN